MAALGIAVGVGILVGSSGGRKGNSDISASRGPTLFGELKRLVLMKGIAFAVSSAEELLADRMAQPKRRHDIERTDPS
jgi:hypothetical protein